MYQDKKVGKEVLTINDVELIQLAEIKRRKRRERNKLLVSARDLSRNVEPALIGEDELGIYDHT